jgi:cephalosporin hydroxylase
MNLKRLAVRWINRLADPTLPSTRPSAGLTELEEVYERARTRTDINEHLVTLFQEALAVRPKLMVELGVRGGESTFVFERVARLCKALLVSVDIDDCSPVCNWKDWVFVKSDDIAFANQFESWCRERKVDPAIDLLFIDTSHLYEHTKQELEHWLPKVAPRGKVLMHDTNVREINFRKDGTAMREPPQPGVARALCEHFKTPFNLTADFVDWKDGWLIRHHAHCHGMTVLERVGALSS